MRQLTRFSLRALLAMVTLFCLMLGYGANWSHQRHILLAEQKERGADEAMKPLHCQDKT